GRATRGWGRGGGAAGPVVERESPGKSVLVWDIGGKPGAPADVAGCVRTLKCLRYDRERADVQREIDRLQELGAARHEQEIVALWERKKDLLIRIESLAH